ncbi:hypothetical protein GCM10009665_34060 [Kitasatospora nipponensis]|uniref:Uncharacterized protein n=2 Tax=Kitasatospora nipponensis TaxID=258049 RepID=A0ABP4GY75_9ACTN
MPEPRAEAWHKAAWTVPTCRNPFPAAVVAVRMEASPRPRAPPRSGRRARSRAAHPTPDEGTPMTSSPHLPRTTAAVLAVLVGVLGGALSGAAGHAPAAPSAAAPAVHAAGGVHADGLIWD